jgi:membrane associated rhomboid family serine protease
MPGRYRFSMPSSRDRTDPWFRLGSVDVTTTVIISFLCVLSFFVYAADKTLLYNLFLIPSQNDVTGSVKGGQVWRLLTWPIANQPDIFVVLSVAIFWYLGSRIEAQLGRTKFLWLLLLVTLLPSIVAVLLDVQTAGIRPLEIAIFVVFVCENPKMPFFFGIPAWILGAVFVGIDILQLLGNRQSEQLIVYLVSIVVAVWTARSFGMINDFQWLPQIKLPGGGAQKRSKRRKSASRSSGGGSGPVVVDGPWPVQPVYRPMQDQAEVDQILDKIALVGMDGLTTEEKKRLNDASTRLRKGGT